VLVTYCESNALQVCQDIPVDGQGTSDEYLGDGVNGGAHVEEEEDLDFATSVQGWFRAFFFPALKPFSFEPNFVSGTYRAVLAGCPNIGG
jgi:hypothetical protein